MGTSLTRSAASVSNVPWGVPRATVLYAWLVLKVGYSTRRGGVCRKEVRTVIHVSQYLIIVHLCCNTQQISQSKCILLISQNILTVYDIRLAESIVLQSL